MTDAWGGAWGGAWATGVWGGEEVVLQPPPSYGGGGSGGPFWRDFFAKLPEFQLDKDTVDVKLPPRSTRELVMAIVTIVLSGALDR